MQKHKGYGLIEVLVSVSLFLIIMTSTSNFICKILLHAKQVEKLHYVLHSVLELNEQLYMLQKHNSIEKKQLIHSWTKNFNQRVLGYCIEVTETPITKQQKTIQVTIKEQNSQLVITVTA